MKINGHENLAENADFALNVIRSGKAYDRVTALALRK